MRNFTLLAVLLLSIPSLAQDHLIGMKGGVSWSNIHSNEIWTDAYRTGFAVGFTYDYRIKQHLFVGGELSYQQRGYQIYFYYTNEFGEILNISENTKFNYAYLSLPLKVGYIVGNKLSGYAAMGLVPSFLLKAKHVLPGVFLNNTLDATEYVQKFDLAGLAEIGGSLKVSDRLFVALSFSYQHSLSTFTHSDYFENVKARHYAFTLCGGIKYAL